MGNDFILKSKIRLMENVLKIHLESEVREIILAISNRRMNKVGGQLIL